jgi:hypothetical protein
LTSTRGAGADESADRFVAIVTSTLLPDALGRAERRIKAFVYRQLITDVSRLNPRSRQ